MTFFGLRVIEAVDHADAIDIVPTILEATGVEQPSAVNGVTAKADRRPWWNWVRIPPLSLIRFGQEMTSGLRVPPKCEAICLPHWKGVSMAHAHPTG
jgi:hypothetical protein